METRSTTEQPWKDYEFKSYYVVWKLKRYILKIVLLCMFKSYYVVWKRENSFFCQAADTEFKSYYVVWKQ